jgi:hypothetical protein
MRIVPALDLLDLQAIAPWEKQRLFRPAVIQFP